MRAGEVSREIYLKRGRVVQAASRLAEETLGAILVSLDVISSKDRDALLERAAAEGRLIGDLLIEAGALTPMGVVEALTEQVRLRVTNCLRLESHQAEFSENRESGAKFRVDLSIPAILLGSVGDAVAPERIVSHLGIDSESRVCLKVPLEEAMSGLEAGPRQMRLIRGLKGVAISAVARNEEEYEMALGVVYTLWALDRLEVLGGKPVPWEPDLHTSSPGFEEREASSKDEPPAPSAEEFPQRTEVPHGTSASASQDDSGGRQAAASTEARASSRSTDEKRRRLLQSLKRSVAVSKEGAHQMERARFRKESGELQLFEAVVDAWLRAERQDFFSLLGVSREAGPSDVKIAYGAMLRIMRLENTPDSWPKEAKDAAAGLLSRVNLALAVLTDSEERKAYLAHLEEGGKEFAPSNQMLLAGVAMRTADRFRARGRLAEAAAELRGAASSFPKDPSIHFALGRTLYEWCSRGGEGDLSEASKALSTAAKLDPALDVPWLYMGLIAIEQQDLETARTMLKRALTVNPKNDRAKAELGKIEPQTGFLGRLFRKS